MCVLCAAAWTPLTHSSRLRRGGKGKRKPQAPSACGNSSNLMLTTLKGRIAAMGYPIPIPDKMQKLESVVPAAEWKSAAEGVYPIMHERLPDLLATFLQLKSAFGQPAERVLYKGMKVEDFVTRMLTKRPLCFFEGSDVFL